IVLCREMVEQPYLKIDLGCILAGIGDLEDGLATVIGDEPKRIVLFGIEPDEPAIHSIAIAGKRGRLLRRHSDVRGAEAGGIRDPLSGRLLHSFPSTSHIDRLSTINSIAMVPMRWGM